jgi:hypothetical protein
MKIHPLPKKNADFGVNFEREFASSYEGFKQDLKHFEWSELFMPLHAPNIVSMF